MPPACAEPLPCLTFFVVSIRRQIPAPRRSHAAVSIARSAPGLMTRNTAAHRSLVAVDPAVAGYVQRSEICWAVRRQTEDGGERCGRRSGGGRLGALCERALNRRRQRLRLVAANAHDFAAHETQLNRVEPPGVDKPAATDATQTPA